MGILQKKHSFVCKGKPNNCWDKSFLPDKCAIKLTATDEKLLTECIQMIWDEESLEKLAFLTSTRKAEAFNRLL